MPEGGILSFDSNLLIHIGIQWFNIVLLTAVLVRILYKPVKKFMDDRAASIREHMTSARRASEEARDLKAEYEKKLTDIGRERSEILLRVERQAALRSEQLVRETKEKAGAMIRQAEETAALELKRGRERMRLEIVELASMIAGKFVQSSMDEELQKHLADQALKEYLDAQ
ncbi:MAG: F0F1 ATP synthase subunit B [Synergistaceae bacterium]|jgi:F-type H+-transporting ATPase subunit b|nr:F0F1 ATP synthase subunit B [Synergistaceae bacterium]